MISNVNIFISVSGDTSTYPLGTGEFVLVKARENRFFAYVTDVRSSRKFILIINENPTLT